MFVLEPENHYFRAIQINADGMVVRVHSFRVSNYLELQGNVEDQLLMLAYNGYKFFKDYSDYSAAIKSINEDIVNFYVKPHGSNFSTILPTFRCFLKKFGEGGWSQLLVREVDYEDFYGR